MIKGQWYAAKLFIKQCKNCLCGQELTPRGYNAYNYYCKIVFEEYNPVTMADFMFEDIVTEQMKYSNVDRRSAAIILGGELARHMKPWDFWKQKRKIIGG